MNRLRLFNYAGRGKFKLLIETQTSLEEKEDYNLKDIEEYLVNDILSKQILYHDLDCIVMINNQALYRFETKEDGSYFCDGIEADVMYHFILWYRKEYKDINFNGSNEHIRVWGMIENGESKNDNKGGKNVEVMEYVLANIDYVIRYRKNDLENKMNEDDKNYGMQAILRTLEIENIKGQIRAYEEIKNIILRKIE